MESIPGLGIQILIAFMEFHRFPLALLEYLRVMCPKLSFPSQSIYLTSWWPLKLSMLLLSLYLLRSLEIASLLGWVLRLSPVRRLRNILKTLLIRWKRYLGSYMLLTLRVLILPHTNWRIWHISVETDKGRWFEPAIWDDFSSAFLDHLFPEELRGEKAEEFMNLKQGKMTVKEYALKFT